MADPIQRTPTDPDESQQGTDQAEESQSSNGSSQKETRWEVGIFARKVTTSSTTPPEYEDPPGG